MLPWVLASGKAVTPIFYSIIFIHGFSLNSKQELWSGMSNKNKGFFQIHI
jgi:hypothetical protein